LQNKSCIASPERQAELVEETLEYIQGMSVVKFFNIDSNHNKKVDAAIEKSRAENLALEKAFVPYIALQQLVLNIAGVAIIFASIFFYTSGSMSLSNCLLRKINALQPDCKILECRQRHGDYLWQRCEKI
jgi:ATP-binding cassette subfamily B protein